MSRLRYHHSGGSVLAYEVEDNNVVTKPVLDDKQPVLEARPQPRLQFTHSGGGFLSFEEVRYRPRGQDKGTPSATPAESPVGETGSARLRYHHTGGSMISYEDGDAPLDRAPFDYTAEEAR
jgi:hypothetical protein